jgi:hypothetical protein
MEAFQMVIGELKHKAQFKSVLGELQRDCFSAEMFTMLYVMTKLRKCPRASLTARMEYGEIVTSFADHYVEELVFVMFLPGDVLVVNHALLQKCLSYNYEYTNNKNEYSKVLEKKKKRMMRNVLWERSIPVVSKLPSDIACTVLQFL